jgi:putative transposase
MSIRAVPFVQSEFYHIYNRGNGKKEIFHDREDYNRFIALLYACNQISPFKSDNLLSNQSPIDATRSDAIVAIGAYCLMPNHFHLLLTQCADGGISKFMQKLSTAYTMYYNKKYNHSGGMFEGKFKAEHCNTDNYLKYMFSYIHLNPLKLFDRNWKTSGLKDRETTIKLLTSYEYSSYLDFVGVTRKSAKILNTSAFPNYFPNNQEFLTEIASWFVLR